MLKIATLMEDTCAEHNALIAEHGLSLYIEYEGKRILFDTGASAHFIDNAYTLGIDLADLDAIVISHGHYDHGGGFRGYAERIGTPCPLYVGKGFFERKCSYKEDRSAGFDRAFAEEKGFTVTEVEKDTGIFPGVFVVTGFRRDSGERIPERFLRLREGRMIPDDFSDEISLCFCTDDGVALAVGCSHPGIINIVSTVSERYGRIAALFGGTHLIDADDERIIRTLEMLSGSGIRFSGLCHCTGDRVFSIAAGKGISIVPLRAGSAMNLLSLLR